MFVIFGTKIKRKTLATKREHCLGCVITTEHELVDTSKWLTLFLIPIVSYKNEFYIRCKACGRDDHVSESRSRSFKRNSKIMEK